MALLSVVIITFNEEKNIARCIHSVRDIADEIIVLDSFSVDRTGEIVKELGGVFHQRAFEGYGDQKNTAVTYCTHPYILFLDADEFLGEPLRDSIRGEKEKGFPYDGYTMNRLNN